MSGILSFIMVVIAKSNFYISIIIFTGYTQHQGSFLEIRGSGDVFVRKQVNQNSLQLGLKTLSKGRSDKFGESCTDTKTLRQGYKDVIRDIAGKKTNL